MEFWAGGEYDIGLFTEKGFFAVDVGFGDTLLSDKPTSPNIGIGTRYIIEFAATSSSHKIKFTNWGHICQNCTELIIDDVRLYTLAELDPSVPHCTVGIINPDFQNEENIFPNPATDYITIQYNLTSLKETTVSLFNVYGQPLTPPIGGEIQHTGRQEIKIDMQSFPAGIYFVKVIADGKEEVKKVVKY